MGRQGGEKSDVRAMLNDVDRIARIYRLEKMTIGLRPLDTRCYWACCVWTTVDEVLWRIGEFIRGCGEAK